MSAWTSPLLISNKLNRRKKELDEEVKRSVADIIKDALHEAGADYRQIKIADIDAIKNGLTQGENKEGDAYGY